MDHPHSRLRVLVANEPRAYREVLAGTLAELRPRLLVHLLEPAELDETTRLLRPALVVCSQLSAVVQAHAGAWLLLPPEGVAPAEIGMGERRWAFSAADLAAVLTAIDAALDTPGIANHPTPEHRPAEDHHAP
jgi:hypothetical protein